jgi:hypothetical protein
MLFITQEISLSAERLTSLANSPSYYSWDEREEPPTVNYFKKQNKGGLFPINF